MTHSLRLSAVIALCSLLLPLGASALTYAPEQRVSRRTLRANPVQTQQRVSAATCPNVTWKNAKFWGAPIAEIPSTWSTYAAGEMALATGFDDFYNHIFFSVGQDGVAFGDTNWSQVDFAKMSGEDVKKLKEWYRSTKEAGDRWSVQRMKKVTADVITFPLDDGKVTKGGTGGKVYFLTWTGPKNADMGLVIWKQAKGNAEFECGVQHFIDTLNVEALTANYVTQYPLKK